MIQREFVVNENYCDEENLENIILLSILNKGSYDHCYNSYLFKAK